MELGEVMIQVYLLYFDTEIMKIRAEVLQLNAGLNNLDNEITALLQSTGYDVHDYSDEIAILVDDQGFFKTGNPVFEIISGFGDCTRLAGRLLFVRNIENEYSVDIDSIKYEDIFRLRTSLQIQLIGLTKGE